jgi:hypothetical protein
MRATGLILALAALALLTPGASAGGWRALDLDARLDAAHEALIGTVSAVNVEARDGEPWTIVTLDVERWLVRDGSVALPDADDLLGTFEAAFWGGRAPGVPTLLVAGMPSFTVGERVLWFLHEPDVGLAAPIVGVDQGVWRDQGGVWTGIDGVTLGVDANGLPELGGATTSDDELFEALTAAFVARRGTP